MNLYIPLLLLVTLLTTSSCKKQQHLALPPEERSAALHNAMNPDQKATHPEKENFLIPLEEDEDKHESIEQSQELNIKNNRQTSKTEQKKTPETKQLKEKKLEDEETPEKSLDFEVENKTGRELFVVCFSYIRKHHFNRWRWDKSAIYKLNPNSTALIDVDFIPDEQDRKNVFGYLGVFSSEQEAEESTFELTDDEKKLDLDLLYKLKDKKVTIEVERYGFKGEFLEYDFIKKKGSDEVAKQELDVLVENQTGKTIHVLGFVYQKKAKGSWFGAIDDKDDMSLWRFDKTPIITLKNGEQGYIDIDTLLQERDRIYIRISLALFDENELDLAEKSTYELTRTWRLLHLDRPNRLKNKKVVINIEQYGINEDFIDFVVKDTQSALKGLGTTDEHTH